VGLVSEAGYAEQVRGATQFLLGDKAGVVRELRARMEEASGSQRYEEAATHRDRMRAVEETLEPQRIEDRRDRRDADAIGLAGDDTATLVKVLKVRDGRVTGADEYFVPEPVAAGSEIARAFLQHHYLAETLDRMPPPELFLGVRVPDEGGFESLLSERRGRRVRLVRPKRGRGLRLLRLAERNAAASLAERKRRSERNEALLGELGRALRLARIPRRIEGYDISNLHGAEPYGSMVVFTDGEADRNRYRYYRIRSVKGSNDFAMLREVFERRFRKLEDENRPDLVLVDGGKGQLRQAVDVLREAGVSGVELVSIAKEKELVSRSGKKYAPERIFLPGQKNPLVFAPSSPVLHLLQRVRDEAHRFGITRHRRSRGKSALASILRRIPAVGPSRQKALVRALGSVERIAASSVEELSRVAGMTRPAARSVYDFFRAAAADGDE
jgi:excinuclease ABC subunit C